MKQLRLLLMASLVIVILSACSQDTLDVDPLDAMNGVTETQTGDSKTTSDSGESDTSDPFEGEKNDILANVQSKLDDLFNQTMDPYLIGWSFSISTSGLTEDQWQSLGLSEQFEEMVVAKEFLYHVKLPYRVVVKDNMLVCQVGKVGQFNDPFAQTTNVEASNTSGTFYHKAPEDTAYESDQIIIHFASITTTSNLVEYTEMVDIEGWNTVNGTLNFQRLGPGASDNQTDVSIDLPVEEGFATGNIPQGDYLLVYRDDSVNFSVIADMDYVFLVDSHEPIFIKGLHSVLGQVNRGDDQNNTPYADADITLESQIEGIDGSFTATTDENGHYTVDNVPLGVYTILVDGSPYGSVIIDEVDQSNFTAETIYIPLDQFDVTIEMITNTGTTVVTFNDVHIGNQYMAPVSYIDGFYYMMEEKEVAPSKVTVTPSEDSGISDYEVGEIYFSIFKTDDSVMGYNEPNTYYLDWMVNIDWVDGESGFPIFSDFDSQGFPVMPDDPYDGKISTADFDALLQGKAPLYHQHYIDMLVYTTITIEPAQ